MEDWLYYSLSIALCALALSFLVVSVRPATGKKPAAATPSLPPGPAALTALGLLLLLAWTSVNIESIVRVARSWYGPVFTVYLRPSSPVVFVADRDVARRVLVQRGAAFADRPPATLATRIFSSDQRNITAGAYGPLWRLLRRNLTGRILHPSSVRRYAAARRSAAERLIAGIKTQMLRGEEGEVGVVVLDGLLHQAVFHVLIAMCFGVGIDDAVVTSIASLQKEFLSTAASFQVFGARPSALTKLLFRGRYAKMLSIRRRHEELFVPLIRARARRRADNDDDDYVACYVDSLLDLTVYEDVDGDGGGGGGGTRRNQQLTESEMVSLCTEFLTGGADSTITALQWTMANVVARAEIQAKLRAEIRHVAGNGSHQQQLDDEHLPQMPYLRAVVLEALRRHPPGRFMVPRAATTEEQGSAAAAMLHGFSVPRHVPVNFTLGDMAMDEAVWPEPQRFRPERFLPGGEGEDVDLTGNKEIKMMPFGAGQRMCPGVDVSLLHLQWFVANMVREFEWKEVPGEPVDFAEKLVLTMVMARPLRAMVMPSAY